MAKVKFYDSSTNSKEELENDIQEIYKKFDEYNKESDMKLPGLRYVALSFNQFEKIDNLLNEPNPNFSDIKEKYEEFEKALDTKYTNEGWEAKNKERDLIKYTLLAKIENCFFSKTKNPSQAEHKFQEELTHTKEAKFINLAHRFKDKEAIKKANELDPENNKYQDVKIANRTWKEFFAETWQNLKNLTTNIKKFIQIHSTTSKIPFESLSSAAPFGPAPKIPVITPENQPKEADHPAPQIPKELTSAELEKILGPAPKIPVITPENKSKEPNYPAPPTPTDISEALKPLVLDTSNSKSESSFAQRINHNSLSRKTRSH